MVKKDKLLHAIKLNYKDNSIFIFHGHQVDTFIRRYNWLIPIVIHYIASPLFIKNYEVSPANQKRTCNCVLWFGIP